MKQTFQKLFSLRLILLLCLTVACIGLHAQDSIVVYSDTTSALEDAVMNDSLWQDTTNGTWDDSSITDVFSGHDMFSLLSGMLGITGVIAILFFILVLLFPILIIGLIIYLVYRLNREKQQNRQYAETVTSENENDRLIRMKENAVQQACWGVGLILVEGVADISVLLGIAGIVLLCMAAYNWLRIQIRK